jgi:BirA family transcriptional regulator, biotin operon repressor / biotin---[acetyl-CoA-carboxylase] ligase
LLLENKKCAGILTVLESSAIIAGIGINVNHSSFPVELSGIATSLRLATGQSQSRERLLAQLLPAVDAQCDLLEREGRGPILELFAHVSSYVSGRRVVVDEGATHLRGTTAGLTGRGFLKLRADDGKDWVVLAGGVRACS